MFVNETPAFVRTLMPFIVGYLATKFGLDKDDPLLSMGVGYGFYVLVHTIELKWPKFGYLLGIAKAPTYATAEAEADVEVDAEAEAEI